MDTNVNRVQFTKRVGVNVNRRKSQRGSDVTNVNKTLHLFTPQKQFGGT